MSRSYSHSASSAPLQTGRRITVLTSVSDVLARLVEAPLTWLQRDRDRRALQALDDRLLHDIGVSRSEVEGEIAKPFWRP